MVVSKFARLLERCFVRKTTLLRFSGHRLWEVDLLRILIGGAMTSCRTCLVFK